MKLFFSYLWAKRRAAALGVISLTVCLTVFALYELPVEAVGYAGLLCVALGLVWALVDFARFYARHTHFTHLLCAIGDELGALPAPDNLIESDHQALLRALDRERAAALTRLESSRRDMMDYYTMWTHQIKTPIAAMRMLLPDGADDLKGQLFRIEEYVSMALTYQRLGSGVSDLVFREVAVDRVVRAAVRRYAPLFVRQRLSLHYDGVALSALTDEKWLQFVIEQVLSNALKYTYKGGVTISGQDGVLVIADTGMGIAPEDLPRIGQKGFTGYNGREDKLSTGLGLYLCHQILSKLGHTMEVESRVGEGTQVSLHFLTKQASILQN